jgi:ectoine hydroxylase-related dioxygenase (phytanoyl-CoA dioxygenase family)
MNIAAKGFGSEEADMQAYFREGEARARALPNRGPLRFTADGKVDPAIIDAYRRYGFYVLEGVLDAAELAELKADLHGVLDRMPREKGAKLDRQGRPAIGADLDWPVVTWSKPLGDPLGGTGLAGGRAPVKMIEPEAANDAPREVPMVLSGPLQFSEAGLRVAGHPGLLAVAAAINGEDFVPFSEALIIKQPGQGGSFAWHQDGATHWDSPDWDPDVHGVNLMVQLYPCTPATTVWFVPGTHATGRADIKRMVAEAGSNRLPDAVPLICEGGDVCISNRQILHGSFPNTSDAWRLTLVLGSHRRDATVGVSTKDVFGAEVTYDAERVRRRAELIGYAIDARRQRFPDESPFVYRPQAAAKERLVWDEAARRRIHNYQAEDLFL